MTDVNRTVPNWRAGFAIFASRPFSLVAPLILAVVLFLVSWMLLLFPLIAGYFYAVRESRREGYFIDIENIFRTCGLLLTGLKRYFSQSFVVGFLGLACPAILLVGPVVSWSVGGDSYAPIAWITIVSWIPACFLIGATVFHAYPRLLITGNGMDAMRYAMRAGKANLWLTLGRGLLLVYPVPGLAIHLMMVLSYPFIAAWALGTASDIETLGQGPSRKSKMSYPRAVGLTLLLALAMVAACFLLVGLWHTAGFVVWLIGCLVTAFLVVPRLTPEDPHSGGNAQ